jgi:hypothetical protein
LDCRSKDHKPADREKGHPDDFLAVEIPLQELNDTTWLACLRKENVARQECADQDELIQHLKGVQQYFVA